MNIETIIGKRNLTYEHYIKQPMQMVELRLNMITAKNQQLIKSLDRIVNHPLIKKHSDVQIFD